MGFKAKNTSSVRIIGGEWGSRRLTFPTTDGLRPTHDRLRETIFNWLAPVIPGANCLDAFAGSGALGFEALSRGAAAATLIDQSRQIVKALEQNAILLKAAHATILEGDFASLCQHLKPASFDVVFLDPPYEKGLLQPAIDSLVSGNLLRENAVIYIEHRKGESVKIPESWEVSRHKKTKNLEYALYSSTQTHS